MLFTETLVIVLVALAPLIGYYLVTNFLDTNQLLNLSALGLETVHYIFFSAWWLLLQWLALAYVWTDYYLDIWVVTNKRIISIEQHGLFRREIGSFRLERLQDMQVKINGLIATFLDFGTVEAETASGSSEEFKADFLPKPREIKALILKAADQRMKNHSTVDDL